MSVSVCQLGVHRGGQQGALPPPPLAGQSSMFFDFLGENSMFLGGFRQIVCFCPFPWKLLPSHGKTSADAHAIVEYNILTVKETFDHWLSMCIKHLKK